VWLPGRIECGDSPPASQCRPGGVGASSPSRAAVPGRRDAELARHLVDAMLRWRDTPWGDAVLLPVHDEIIAMVPEQNGPAATAVLVACMQSKFRGVPIVAKADEPARAWADAA